jgi:hypothetical protein
MRTTVTLEPEAYELARKAAFQRRESIGKVLSDAILSQLGSLPTTFRMERDARGLPQISIGRSITSEEVAAAIEEE